MKNQFTYLLLLLLFGFCLEVQSQEGLDISFESKSIKVSKKSTQAAIYSIAVKTNKNQLSKWKNHTLTVDVNSAKTTLPSSEYKLNFPEKNITELDSEETIFLTLEKDTLADRERKLYLTLNVRNKANKSVNEKNNGTHKEIEIIIEAHNKTEDQAQNTFDISFEKDTLTLSKSTENTIIQPIVIKSKNNTSPLWKNHTLTVEVNEAGSTLPSGDYSISFESKGLNNLKETETFYITLPKDTLADRERKLHLKLNVTNGAKKEVNERNSSKKELVVLIKEHKTVNDELSDYSYLTYVGTNFDLVEGKIAKNLFFASNVYIPPVEGKNRYGFYLSLYGNRAMSDIDSTGNVRRTYKIESVNDTTFVRHTEQTKMITTRVSDNIGAHINVLIRLSKKNSTSDLKLFYSPSLEFVWRRTKIEQAFKNPILRDSTIVYGDNPGSMEYDSHSRKKFNEYSFNAGIIGFFMTLENKKISVRVHASVGYSSNYFPHLSEGTNIISSKRASDIFFSGRAWITEPVTGITLQAEITNTALNPRPFFGATLSKAFNFSSISKFFNPIVRDDQK